MTCQYSQIMSLSLPKAQHCCVPRAFLSFTRRILCLLPMKVFCKHCSSHTWKKTKNCRIIICLPVYAPGWQPSYRGIVETRHQHKAYSHELLYDQLWLIRVHCTSPEQTRSHLPFSSIIITCQSMFTLLLETHITKNTSILLLLAKFM